LTKAIKDPDSQVREKAVGGSVLLGMTQVISAAALAAQVARLAPCKIEGVPARQVRLASGARRSRPPAGRRMSVLSIIVLSALEPTNSDPFFMLQADRRCAVVQRAFLQPRLSRHPPQARHRPRRSARHRQSSPLLCPELAKPGADGIYDATC
jgi:hypothetical protein